MENISADELKRLFPGATKSILKANTGAQGLPASQPQQPEGKTLVNRTPRETKGGNSLTCRYRIIFTFYACRPLDWDNCNVKQLQDIMVQVGLLPSDDWKVLEGHIISKKAHTREEERTEIVIERLA